MSTIDLSERGAGEAVRGIVDPGVDPREAVARAAWSCLAEPGDSVAGRLIAHRGPVAALRAVLEGTLQPLDGLEASELEAARRRWSPRVRDAGEPLAAARRAGARLLVPGGARWPARGAELGPHAPSWLWALGDVARLASSTYW